MVFREVGVGQCASVGGRDKNGFQHNRVGVAKCLF